MLWLFVGPTRVYLLDFFCSGIQFNLLLSPYPCFISLLNLDLYDRSKAVLLLWIFYVFVLSCVCYVFVRVCLYVLCGHLLGKGWPLGSHLWCLLWVCHFPIGILGQVWYLIVSIPDLCTLTYFYCKNMQILENLAVFEILITQNRLKCPKDPFVRSALICIKFHKNIWNDFSSYRAGTTIPQNLLIWFQ